MRTLNRTAAVIAFIGMVGLAPLGAGGQGPSTQGQPPPGQPPSGAAPQQPPGQPPPAQQPPPVFRGGVNFVRVDVIVTDRQGNTVTDLTRDDFEISEDGKPQTVELFRLINTDGNPQPGQEPARQITSAYAEESEAARDDVRLFVIFLDDYHVRLGSSMRVREPLVRFLETQLGPLDMVALMYPLTPVTGMQFTRDRDGVENALRKFEGRKYDYRPRNEFEEQYAMYPAEVVERVRNEVTLSALKGLSVKLGSLREGRKAVVFVSEGFTNMLPPQLRDPSAAFPGLGNPARNNPFAGEGRGEDSARFFADAEMQTQLQEVYDTANRNNTAIYALDPRGLATNEFDINDNVGSKVDGDLLRSTQDTLRVLADQTDGRAIVNQNDLDKGLRQMVRDTSWYYLVGYTSAQAPADGKFHRIEVRLKRPGLQVRARKGYWAMTADDMARATGPRRPGPPPAVERAIGTVEARPRGTFVSTWIGTSRNEDGTTKVTFVWEALPPVPGLTRPEPARVALLAAGPDGSPYFRGKVPDAAAGDPPAGGAASPPTGIREPSRITFDADPGRMQVRVSVENAAGQVLDSSQQDVAVPDLNEPKAMLSTPEVLRGRTAREFQALSRETDPVPTALREFRRTDRLLIRFFTYGPGGAAPAATARLLNRSGQRMADLPVQAPAAAGGYAQIDLPLAGLASGEYLVEVRVPHEGGDATELIPLRVIS